MASAESAECTEYPPGPSFFEWYMAWSAFFSSVVASGASFGNWLTPTLAEM
jgi:hypothetical protein